MNKFIQALYYNEKVYNYLINFIFQNKQLLINLRLKNFTEDIEIDEEKIRKINKMFHRIFKLLIAMTTSYTKTQELMWKYKQDFVFKKLGDSSQDGELELVL